MVSFTEVSPDTTNGSRRQDRRLGSRCECVELISANEIGRAYRRHRSSASVDVERAIMGATSRISVERIVIELEIPRDSGSLFRLRLDNKVVGEHLTAVQTHLLVGEILDRITLPRLSERE
jgi:hypothetical protein